VQLELHDVVTIVLLLEVVGSAEVAERAVGVDQAGRDLHRGRANCNDIRCDHILHFPIDLGDRLDVTEVAGDATQLFVHLEERVTVALVGLGVDWLGRRSFACDLLIDRGVEDLGVEDRSVTRQTTYAMIVLHNGLLDLSASGDAHLVRFR
jgi:hypothetical protein